MSNSATELELKTTTKTARKRAGTASSPTLAAMKPVRCNVSLDDGETRIGKVIGVSGPKDFRDPVLRDAILERLAAAANHTEVYNRCEAEMSAAEQRVGDAEENLSSLIRSLGGHLVVYGGLTWGLDFVRDAFPAAPTLLLID